MLQKLKQIHLSQNFKPGLAQLVIVLVAAALCAAASANAQIRTAGNLITSDEISPEAFPTPQLKLEENVLQQPELKTDPFNAYVPGLSAYSRLNLQPYLEIPYAHFPYLQKGRAPKDRADIAIASRVFVDLAVSGYATFSDNLERSADDRKAGMIYGIVLNIDTFIQITDDLQLIVAGNLAYYYVNGHGYSDSGFGFNDSFYFSDTFRFHDGVSLDGKLLFVSQFRWVREISNISLELSDRFSVNDRVMENPFVDGAFSRTKEFVNTATARSGCLFPAQTRVGLDYHNVNYWHDSDFKAWDRQENRLVGWLSVERDSMRFRPFADYSLRHVGYFSQNDNDGWVHEGHAGLQGPVTENMNAEAGVGYAKSTGENALSDVLWRVYIDHVMNSRTRHQIRLERTTRASPSTTMGSLTEFQYRLGRRIHNQTTLWLGAQKNIYDLKDDEKTQTDNWGLLASLSFVPVKNMTAGLDYEYINWSTTDDEGPDDFYENRLTLTLTWDI